MIKFNLPLIPTSTIPIPSPWKWTPAPILLPSPVAPNYGCKYSPSSLQDQSNVILNHCIELFVNVVKYEWGYWHMQVLCVQWGVHRISVWSSQKLLPQWNLPINIRRKVREWYHGMVWGVFSLVSSSPTSYNFVNFQVLWFCAFLTSKLHKNVDR